MEPTTYGEPYTFSEVYSRWFTYWESAMDPTYWRRPNKQLLNVNARDAWDQGTSGIRKFLESKV